jgi:hypothetical protein
VRIGEILRNDGVLTSWQLDAALRMQTQYGGRLASNAIELGYVDPDVAARALGRQLKVPAALQKHFAAIEPQAVARFTPKIAEKYQAIPLGYSTKQARTIIVAFVDPTQLAAIDEIQFLLGHRVMAAVAPEIRIARALERHYGLAPKRQRGDFVRVAADRDPPGEEEFESSKHAYAPKLTPPPSYHPAPAHPDLSAPPVPDLTPPASDPRMVDPRTPDPPPSLPMSLPPLGATPRDSSDQPPPPSAPGRLARSHAKTKQEVAPTVRQVERIEIPAPEAVPKVPEANRALRPNVTPARESRMPPRGHDPRADPAEATHVPAPPRPPTRATEGAAGWSMPPHMPPPPEPAGRPALSAGDAIETIHRAHSREVIGQAILDYLRSSFGCGALLVTRHDIALGWKAFAAIADDSGSEAVGSIESLALPLTQPSILAIAYEGQSIFRGAPPRDGDEIHARLFKALRTAPPLEAVVAPIVVAERVVTLVYAQPMERGVLSGAALRDLTAVCAAAASAYVRLIHDARSGPPQ